MHSGATNSKKRSRYAIIILRRNHLLHGMGAARRLRQCFDVIERFLRTRIRAIPE